MIIGRWEKNGGDFNEAIVPFAVYPKKYWWDVACIDSGIPAQVLKDMTNTSLSLLREALVPYHIHNHPLYIHQKNNMQLDNNNKNKEPSIMTLFNLEFFGLLMGIFELNNQSISIGSPLQELLNILPNMEENMRNSIWKVLYPTVREIINIQDQEQHVHSDDDNNNADTHNDMDGETVEDEMDDSCDESVRLYRRVVNRGEEVFPTMEGIGIFKVSATMNHSCVPNTIVKYAKNNVAHLYALRDINIGEEMTHSYIEDTMSFEDRNADLEAYGFQCDCPKCQIETSDKMQ